MKEKVEAAHNTIIRVIVLEPTIASAALELLELV